MSTYTDRRARQARKMILMEKFTGELQGLVQSNDTFFLRVIKVGSDTRTITVLRSYIGDDGKAYLMDESKRVAFACGYKCVETYNENYLVMVGSQYNPCDYLKDALVKLFGFNVKVETY